MEKKLLAKAYIKIRPKGHEHFVNFYQNGTKVFRTMYDLTPGQQDEYVKDGRDTFSTFDACKESFECIMSKNKNILLEFITY